MSDHDPRGEPAIRVLAMPADTNANGDIFGGWLMSQMDIAGATVAIRRAQGRVVTVAVDAMTFHLPVYVGDIVSCYGRVVKVGRTSVQVHIEAWARRGRGSTEEKVTEGTFTYVAIGEDRKSRPLPAGAP
ncbi:MAG: acyl-CoA thioesterase [Myxococcales bacterium]